MPKSAIYKRVLLAVFSCTGFDLVLGSAAASWTGFDFNMSLMLFPAAYIIQEKFSTAAKFENIAPLSLDFHLFTFLWF